MSYELTPSVQAVLDVFPEKKKDNFDRVMDVAHLLMDGTVGTICGSINSLFQTYALMQGRRDARKIVKYTCTLEETKVKAAVEMRRLEVQSELQKQRYDLQKQMLTLYVDRQYQNTVDQITRHYQEASYRVEKERYNAILEIDKYTKDYTQGMDRKYRQILRQEEAICAAYRDVLHEMAQHGISRNQVAAEMFNRTLMNSERLSDYRFNIIIDAIVKMTEPNFIPFDEFVKMRGDFLKG